MVSLFFSERVKLCRFFAPFICKKPAAGANSRIINTELFPNLPLTEGH